jgi:hypothetical protein
MVLMRFEAFALWIAAYQGVCSTALIDADEVDVRATVTATTAECTAVCLFRNHQLFNYINRTNDAVK